MKKKALKGKTKKEFEINEDKNILKEEAAPYITKKSRRVVNEDDDDLTAEQIKSLEEAIAEADRGETVSFEEFKKAMSRWLTKRR